MRCTHNDAIRISNGLICSIIDIKHTSPFSGPEVVCTQTKQQLENVGIEVVIESGAIRTGLIINTTIVSNI